MDYTIPQGQGGMVCQTHMHTAGREDEETECLLQQPYCMLPSDFIDFFCLMSSTERDEMLPTLNGAEAVMLQRLQYK